MLPRNALNEMIFFLEAGGYQLANTFSRKTPVVEQTRCYLAGDGRKPIILAESKDAYALSAVLGDTSSGLMNVIDGLDCVSFYPKLTLAGICRGGDIQFKHEETRFDEQGLDFRRNSGGGLAPCGYACANLWRAVRGARAIGSFRWGESTGIDSRILQTAPLVWRLGGTCDNIFCANPL